MGTLCVVASAERLQEVDVVARKLPIRFEVDKITYDMGMILTRRMKACWSVT